MIYHYQCFQATIFEHWRFFDSMYQKYLILAPICWSYIMLEGSSFFWKHSVDLIVVFLAKPCVIVKQYRITMTNLQPQVTPLWKWHNTGLAKIMYTLSPGIGLLLEIFWVKKLIDIIRVTHRPVCQQWKGSSQWQVLVKAHQRLKNTGVTARNCQRWCKCEHRVADTPVLRAVECQQSTITSQLQQLPANQQRTNLNDDDDDCNHYEQCNLNYDESDERSTSFETSSCCSTYYFHHQFITPSLVRCIPDCTLCTVISPITHRFFTDTCSGITQTDII